LKVVRIRFSETLAIYGFGAEMFAEYRDFIRRIVPEDEFIPLACIGDTFGYLPMNEHIEEGGYEVERFQSPFGLEKSEFREYPEETIKINLIELIG